MYTVTQAARSANVSTTSIRNWSKLYAEYLSPSANPPPGNQREFTPADLAVFSTVAVLRSQLVEPEEIRAALDEGQRLEPISPPHEQPAADQDQADQAAEARAAVNAAETAIAIYRDRVTTLEARADQLADRLIAAEARAAAAERELEILRELHAAADPGRKMTFWEWVQSRRR